jgi:hypothetical protein
MFVRSLLAVESMQKSRVRSTRCRIHETPATRSDGDGRQRHVRFDQIRPRSGNAGLGAGPATMQMRDPPTREAESFQRGRRLAPQRTSGLSRTSSSLTLTTWWWWSWGPKLGAVEGRRWYLRLPAGGLTVNRPGNRRPEGLTRSPVVLPAPCPRAGISAVGGCERRADDASATLLLCSHHAGDIEGDRVRGR